MSLVIVNEDQAIARRQGTAKRQGLAVWASREALAGAKRSDRGTRRSGFHQVDGLVLVRLAPEQVAQISDQVAAQEGGDEAVGVPEAEAPAEARSATRPRRSRRSARA